LEENSNSLYCFSGRSHVISFDNLNAESDLLSRNSPGFKVRFLETGTYNYRCQIYTRMRGLIEVFDVKPKIPVVKNIKQLGQLINQAAIPQVKEVKTTPLAPARRALFQEEEKKSGESRGAVSATSDLSLRLL
jgi:hypothetical protein